MTGKKILFTSHTANFSKFNRPFMRALRDQGNEVHYASAGEEKVLDCDKHFTVPFARSPLKRSNIEAYKQLKKVIDSEQYDLIHTHTPMGSVVTRLAARGARKKGTRVIYTAHGFHFFKGAPLLNWLLYYPIEKIMARQTDALVTINREDFGRAKKRFTTKVHYIPGVGVDLERFKPVGAAQKRDLRKKYGYKNSDFILIYIAELNDNKNQTFLINYLVPLLIEIPNIRLLLCGVGNHAEKCKRLVDDLCISNHVDFLGYRNDVEHLLAISDIAVSSSKREGLGINLIEAMAVGLPLIASNNRGHRDVIKHGVNGYLFGDGQKFVKAVLKIYKNPTIAKQMRHNNTRVVAKFSIASAQANMRKIYRETTK